MSKSVPITIAYGNGIGPEIMSAVLKTMEAAGANIIPEVIEIGETVYQKGITSGIEEKSWNSLYKTKVFLKAPITTPQGGGFRSLNVTIRRKLGLYANIRPCVSYYPFVPTKHHNMNVIIIRENEEDLYTGIEYQQSQEMFQCLKLISKSGSRRINRFAFEYALKHKRKKVTCFTKDNIMKKTDGLFRKIFEEEGEEYPELEKEHWIVDIGSAKLADSPENFDVLVLPNLYGDILSDVAAQISGSVGMAGSANIGEKYAMFEAIHGSAPRRAGQNMANPSGLLQAAVLMLIHIGQKAEAENIQNAWLKTLEDGIHTYDIYQESLSQKKVGTKEFVSALIERLGEKPQKLKAVSYQEPKNLKPKKALKKDKIEEKTLVGVDVFIDAKPADPKELSENIQKITSSLKLEAISSRGVDVWPAKSSQVLLSDHWRLRFIKEEGFSPIKHEDILKLLSDFNTHNIDFIKTENLYLFDGKPGFSSSKEKTQKLMKILFVCFGNICRSPAAEAIMNSFIKKEGLKDFISCDSAGTSKHHAGQPADPRMIEQAKIKGYNIESISRTFETEDFDQFDWIITMDDHNYESVLSLARNPEQKKQVLKMAQFSKNSDFIPDPYYGETASFKQIISLLEESSVKLLEKLKKDLQK